MRRPGCVSHVRPDMPTPPQIAPHPPPPPYSVDSTLFLSSLLPRPCLPAPSFVAVLGHGATSTATTLLPSSLTAMDIVADPVAATVRPLLSDCTWPSFL